MEISFDQVVEIWKANAGKDTAGILPWFRLPVTNSLILMEIRANQVGDLLFIGEESGGVRGVLTNGSYKISDAIDQSTATSGFQWDPSWCIVTVRDPENKQQVILGGNTRAHQLFLAVRSGSISPELKTKIIVGELNILVVRISKAISSLWR
jgi:hypothetical protein